MTVQNNIPVAAQAINPRRSLDDAARRAYWEQKSLYLMTDIMFDLSSDPRPEVPTFVASAQAAQPTRDPQ